MRTTPEECIDRFGSPGSNPQFYTVMRNSPGLADTIGIPCNIYCHRSMLMSLTCVFDDMFDTGLRFRSWDECYRIRDRRSIVDPHDPPLISEFSLHSWALAVDVNVQEPLDPSRSPEDVSIIRIFRAAGFYWGGAFERKDPAHFELRREKL